METETTRICKGPLHKKDGEGTAIPRDSFASERSHWCRRCQSDYDQRRGRTRGASRASRKEQRNNNQPTENEDMLTMNNNNKRNKSKQDELELKGPGVERVQIKAVDKAVDRYVLRRDERMELTKREVEAKTQLVGILREHKDKIGTDKEGTIIYRHDDMLVTLRHGKDDLKVRTAKEDDENGGED